MVLLLAMMAVSSLLSHALLNRATPVGCVLMHGCILIKHKRMVAISKLATCACERLVVCTRFYVQYQIRTYIHSYTIARQRVSHSKMVSFLLAIYKSEIAFKTSDLPVKPDLAANFTILVFLYPTFRPYFQIEESWKNGTAFRRPGA